MNSPNRETNYFAKESETTGGRDIAFVITSDSSPKSAWKMRPGIDSEAATRPIINSISPKESNTLIYDVAFEQKMAHLEQRLEKLDKNQFVSFQIQRLPHFNLSVPINVIIDSDEDSFLATAHDLDLFGAGDSPVEALDNLKTEIESLIRDLSEHDELSQEFKRIKTFIEGCLSSNEESTL